MIFRLMSSHVYSVFWVYLIAGMLLMPGCSQNNAQREFEREAFSLPQGITETDDRGTIIDENRDDNDWRVAPFFSGTVSVSPIYPNPVRTNERLIIEIFITGVDAVSGLLVFSNFDFNTSRFLYSDSRRPLPPGLVSISLNPLDVTRFRENPQGVFRIIVTDAQENVITYGDVKIE